MCKRKWGRPRLFLRLRAELCRMDGRFLIAGAGILLLCGALSALSAGSPAEYYSLCKPRGAAPAWLFPPIWTLLYALIGGAAGAVCSVRERSLEADKYRGLLFFIIMMIFNFIWAPLFFGACAYFAAFCAIIMMLILTVLILFSFWRIYRLCGIAMLVYLLWLLYAAYLNLAILILA